MGTEPLLDAGVQSDGLPLDEAYIGCPSCSTSMPNEMFRYLKPERSPVPKTIYRLPCACCFCSVMACGILQPSRSRLSARPASAVKQLTFVIMHLVRKCARFGRDLKVEKWSFASFRMVMSTSLNGMSASLNGMAGLNGQSATPDYDHNDYNAHLRQLEQGSKVQLQDRLHVAQQCQFLQRDSREREREREIYL